MYTMDHSNLIACSFMETSIGLKRVNHSMVVATIYGKTHLHTHLNRKLYPSSKGFLIRIQNVCGNTILMCLIPILVSVVYDEV